MVIVSVAAAWVLVGAVLGLYEARRGHWHSIWLLGAMAGPFALPLFRQIEQNERLARPVLLSDSSRADHPGVSVLAGVDGSDESVRAARSAAELFGSRLADLTLAVVAEFEVNETMPGPLTSEGEWAAEPKRIAADAAGSLSGWLGFEPATVLLAGRPATALVRYATDHEHDVVVVGSRGRGLTKRLLGSCASQLTTETTLPAMIMPRLVVPPDSKQAAPARAGEPPHRARHDRVATRSRPGSTA